MYACTCAAGCLLSLSCLAALFLPDCTLFVHTLVVDQSQYVLHVCCDTTFTQCREASLPLVAREALVAAHCCCQLSLLCDPPPVPWHLHSGPGLQFGRLDTHHLGTVVRHHRPAWKGVLCRDVWWCVLCGVWCGVV